MPQAEAVDSRRHGPAGQGFEIRDGAPGRIVGIDGNVHFFGLAAFLS